MTGYYNPVNVIDSEDWEQTWITVRDELAVSNPLVITSQGNYRRLNLQQIFPAGTVFTDVVENPNFTSCQEAIRFSSQASFDCVLAIGGGSVMDTAKAVMAAMGTGVSELSGLLPIKAPYPHRIPAVFVPTTHGTSSEVTMWGTIWNLEERKKYSISHPDLYPDTAILDGSLTLSMPLTISLTTALDALSHSFEAIWNKNSNRKSTGFAIQAITMIVENLAGLKQDTSNLRVRRNLLKAANIAGLAFSNTKTAAAHSISYPLTSFYNIPHGIAASMPLIPLIELNQKAIKVELNQIRENLSLKGNDDLKSLIKSIPGEYLKFRLKDWGVNKNDLAKLVDHSFTKGRMDNNIVDLAKDDVAWILNEMF